MTPAPAPTIITPRFRVLLAPTLELARGIPDVIHATVEAEYGANVMCAPITLAHHVPSQRHNPAPCVWPDLAVVLPAEGVFTVLVSHFDLDTLGGVLRLDPAHFGLTPLVKGDKASAFWRVAGRVDLIGPHRLDEALAPERQYGPSLEDAIRGFWVWSRQQPRFAPDAVSDITEFCLTAARTVQDLLYRTTQEADDLIRAGRQAKEDLAKLDRDSFQDSTRGVLLRRVPDRTFTAHLHTHEGVPGRGTVNYSDETGAITIALERETPGVSCSAIVQRLWGPAAGGHRSIAGSPRGQRMTWEDALTAAIVLADALDDPQPEEPVVETWWYTPDPVRLEPATLHNFCAPSLIGAIEAWALREGVRHVTVTASTTGIVHLTGANADSVVQAGDRTVRTAQNGVHATWDVVSLPAPPWAPGPSKLVLRDRAAEDVAWFANVCRQTLGGVE